MVYRLGLDRLFVSAQPDEVRSILVRLARDLDTDLTAARTETFCAELMVLGPPPVVQQV